MRRGTIGPKSGIYVLHWPELDAWLARLLLIVVKDLDFSCSARKLPGLAPDFGCQGLIFPKFLLCHEFWLWGLTISILRLGAQVCVAEEFLLLPTAVLSIVGCAFLLEAEILLCSIVELLKIVNFQSPEYFTDLRFSLALGKFLVDFLDMACIKRTIADVELRVLHPLALLPRL